MTLSQSIRSLDFFENLSDEQIDVLCDYVRTAHQDYVIEEEE